MTRPGDRLHKIEGRIWSESEKAIKFQVEVVAGSTLDNPLIEWFPFSQVKSIDRRTPGSDEHDSLQVSEWILTQKNLERYIGNTVPSSSSPRIETMRGMNTATGFDDMDDDIPF